MKQLAAVLAVCVPLAAGAQRFTEECDAHYGTGDIYIVTTVAAESALLAMVRDPGGNPDVFYRFWTPTQVTDIDFSAYPPGFSLRFDTAQDTEQIAQAIIADPVLQQLGVIDARPNSTQICYSPGPPPERITLTEYYNTTLAHYFLSSTAADNAFIDGGLAGPGWQRTGETFRTIEPGYCYGSRPVFRFYTPIANTHVFTMDTRECAAIRHGGGWHYEGQSFGATAPLAGACPANTTPLYRLYNNRWMFNDNNHRYATRAAVRQQMVAQGWMDEGIAMCLFN